MVFVVCNMWLQTQELVHSSQPTLERLEGIVFYQAATSDKSKGFGKHSARSYIHGFAVQ